MTPSEKRYLNTAMRLAFGMNMIADRPLKSYYCSEHEKLPQLKEMRYEVALMACLPEMNGCPPLDTTSVCRNFKFTTY
jgi:hypothetical protein